MRKGKVKTYVLNEDGNYELYDDIQKQLERECHINPEQLPYEINKALKTNPFLLTYNPNIKNNIESLEKFEINYKNQNIALENVIRDDSILKKQKIKIISKQLKHWKKEAINQLEDITDKDEKQYHKSYPETYKCIKSINIFYLILAVIVSLILIFNIIYIIPENKISNIINIVSIICFIIAIILIIIQKNKIKKYNHLLFKHFNELKKFVIRSRKIINKNYKIIKKYYSKNYKNNHFNNKPYELNRVNINMKEFETIQKDNKNLLENYEKIKKENKGINIFYHFPLIMSYALLILNIGYILIMLVIYLFKIIFMKGE